MTPPQTSREWNAAAYHRLSAPQFQWGQRVLSQLWLSGDECLLDAGCGTGKLTRILLQNLPSGRATPDQSPSAHRLSNPLQVRRAPIFNANLNALRKLVGMQLTQRLAHAIEGV